jgi:hypothetical protein
MIAYQATLSAIVNAVLVDEGARCCAGGKYVWCTAGAPASRLKYLETLQPQNVDVYDIDPEQGHAPRRVSSEMLPLLCAAPGRHFVYAVTV